MMALCHKLLKQEDTARIESMQQSSAITSLHHGFLGGCRGLLHALYPPRSAFLFQQFFSTVSSLHPTSFLQNCNEKALKCKPSVLTFERGRAKELLHVRDDLRKCTR